MVKYRGESCVLDDTARADAPGQFVRLPDGSTHYQIAGPLDAQVVVLISGFSVPYFIWDPSFETLAAAGFRVLRYDLYGRGFSDRPDTVYDQDLFDRQLWDLLAALEVDQPVDLVGLSMGGAIAVVFADRHPETVRKLCLMDPAGLPWVQSAAAGLVALPRLGEWIMNLVGDRVILANLKGYFRSEKELAAFVPRFREQMKYIGFKGALLSTIRSGVTTGAEESYRRVGQGLIPVMLFWGRDDQVVPFELSEQVVALLPNAVFHPIADAAHLPHWEQTETVNPLLVAFLKE